MAFDLNNGASKETFNNLYKYKIKLNPKKCVFSVSLGKLLCLGYRRWSKESWSHQTIATTPNTMRNPEASWHDGNTQSTHVQVERMWHAFLQATAKSGWLPVGWTGNNDFHRTQEVSKVLANTDSTEVWWCSSTLRFHP
jgi:hypothetical protein